MDNIYLFLSLAFIFTFFVGRVLEKIRVPWIFAALILGTMLAYQNPFSQITSNGTFEMLAQLGMYFLLFIVGFEINLKIIKKESKFIAKSTIFIILLETIFISLLVHYLFNYGWQISILVALSFATVGEAILIPILDEFGIINTKLGQSIIGIGTMDDIFEIIALIFLSILLRVSDTGHLFIVLISLLGLFSLTVLFAEFRHRGEKFSYKNIESVFFLTIFVFFLFIGIGQYADSSALGALLAGISLKMFLPKNRLKLIENEVKAVAYGFFAPIFFLWIGISMDIQYIIANPLLIIILVAASNGLKLAGSYIMGKKHLGTNQSVLLGIALSVRFSTSIIIIKILYDNNLIHQGLYSVTVASSIIFTIIIPVVFSNLLARWVKKEKTQKL